MALDTSDFKNGLKIDIDGSPYVIVYFQHVKPGKGGAFVRTKIKNLLNGKSVDKTFRSGEKVKEADVEERSEERRVGKRVDLGGRRITKKKTTKI